MANRRAQANRDLVDLLRRLLLRTERKVAPPWGLWTETFLLTATIEAIVAQRLVRRVCSKCKEFFTPSEEQLMELALRPSDVEGRKFARGRGCETCLKSGYKGRMALFEIMTMDDELRELVIKQASTRVLRTEARKRGMRTLREDGWDKVLEGVTTIDEILRVTEDNDMEE